MSFSDRLFGLVLFLVCMCLTALLLIFGGAMTYEILSLHKDFDNIFQDLTFWSIAVLVLTCGWTFIGLLTATFVDQGWYALRKGELKN